MSNKLTRDDSRPFIRGLPQVDIPKVKEAIAKFFGRVKTERNAANGHLQRSPLPHAKVTDLNPDPMHRKRLAERVFETLLGHSVVAAIGDLPKEITNEIAHVALEIDDNIPGMSIVQDVARVLAPPTEQSAHIALLRTMKDLIDAQLERPITADDTKQQAAERRKQLKKLDTALEAPLKALARLGRAKLGRDSAADVSETIQTHLLSAKQLVKPPDSSNMALTNLSAYLANRIDELYSIHLSNSLVT